MFKSLQVLVVERLFLGVLKEDLFYFFLKNNFSRKFLFSLYSYSGLLVLT